MGIGAISKPAIFFDRDGVIVEEIYYVHTGEWERRTAWTIFA
jgi:histidinol phosphatase-like enzyme